MATNVHTSTDFDDLQPKAKFKNLDERLKALEAGGSKSNASILGPISGSTTGQAPPSQTVLSPSTDTRLKLHKNSFGSWVIPDGAVATGQRYIALQDGSHFDLINDVDVDGYVTLHK